MKKERKPAACIKMPLWLSLALKVVLVAIVLVGCFVVLEYSFVCGEMPIVQHLREMELRFIALNIFTLGAVWAALMIICNRVWLSSLLLSLSCGLIAVINYYVIKYNGMPLSFLQLRNFATAMDVIDGYSFSPTRSVCIMLMVCLGLSALSILARWLRPVHTSLRRILLRDGALALAIFAVFYVGYFGSSPIKPLKTISWKWRLPYQEYGYSACTVETAYQLLYAASMPEGYSKENIENIPIVESTEKDTASPDIVLILNESFYDLESITDLHANAPYLDRIENLDNVLKGSAITPSIGGATNSTEYELLASNSLRLLPGITPFNTLNLKDTNSIVSHLSKLGYQTLAAHCQRGINYSRITAYPALGFDRSHFFEDFSGLKAYDGRIRTDESVYQNLIRWYEESPDDSPHFMYVLTYQNHGPYTRMAPEYDTITAQSDYGKYDDYVDEFLTSISLSDEAFADLTEYFSQVDRPVIVCMLGDHCPNFAPKIADPQFSNEEKNLLLRQAPLYIWANFPLEERELGNVSMPMVVPTLLDIAGVELSPYYDYLLQMREKVPTFTSYGNYYDAEGNVYNMDSDDGAPYEELIDNYFFMEYNNLQKADQRRQELFEPYSMLAAAK